MGTGPFSRKANWDLSPFCHRCGWGWRHGTRNSPSVSDIGFACDIAFGCDMCFAREE